MTSSRPVHFGIPATHPKTLIRFYGELFGWTFQRAPFEGPEYWMCETGSDRQGINDAVIQRLCREHPWTNYVGVASIDSAIERATNMGATVAVPRTPIPGMGAYSAIEDPDGNLCGLWEAAAGSE